MKSLRVVVKEDLAIGELGFILKSVRLMDYPMVARSGDLVAHDILEHQNGLHRIGSIDDELEALGGVWFVRGQLGYLQPDRPSIHTVESSIAADVTNMCPLFIGGVRMRTATPRTRATDDTEVFDLIADIASREIDRELEYSGNEMPALAVASLKQEYLRSAVHYMRCGYSKAKRRFHNNEVMANQQFWSIAEAVSRCMPMVDYEGQEFILSYGKGEARMRECRYDDYGNCY